MTLAAGTKLGPYEILASLGAGGMGEVYRARDTRLDRIVAIKTLLRSTAADPDLLRRFEREARLISAVSHPHICALFDVGHEGEINFLVMEYLEGETLTKRLERGPLPISEVLQRGIEIADALEKAHRTGIVHRDLKPGNIILTKSGVKLLDFGLAKIVQREPQSLVTAVTACATQDPAITTAGTIVGTFQYMAPEQLEGEEADARTDIFALGAVLYEMTTGHTAFSGKTRASLIGNIMSTEPAPMATLQPLSPPALERVIRTCLAKDPDERWQTAHDVKLELKWVLEGGSEAGVPAPLVARRKLRECIAWSLAGVLALTTLAATAGYLSRAPKPPRRLQFTVNPAPGTSLGQFSRISISPDGTKISFPAIRNDVASIWLRSLDTAELKLLEGTEGAGGNFWLPDSENVGFWKNGRFQRVNAAVGVVESLCPFPKRPFGQSWNVAGDVLFGTKIAKQDTIHVINLSTCQVRDVLKPDLAKYDLGYALPHFLPDGKHFFFSALRSDKQHDVRVGSLDSDQNKLVVHNGSDARYTKPGLVLFEREGQLLAQPFNLDRLEASGAARTVVNRQVIFAGVGGVAMYDASLNGVLIYREQDVAPLEITWRDLAGRVLERLPEQGVFDQNYLSRDGTKVVGALWDLGNHSADVQLLDLRTKSKSRVTYDNAAGGVCPVLSPDGSKVLYSSDALTHLKIKSLNSDAEPRIIVSSQPGEQVESFDWSPDGQHILYGVITKDGRTRLYLVSPQGGEPKLLAGTSFDETSARFSPDGHWIVYPSDESGRWEVYVRGVDDDSRKWQISEEGGNYPHWGADGKKVLFISAQNQLSSAAFTPAANFKSKPQPLFEVPPDSQFDVTRDGKRILLTAPVRAAEPPITVLMNWTPVN